MRPNRLSSALFAVGLGTMALPSPAALGEPWLPATAFRVAPPCALDPFAPFGAQRIERMMGQQCRHADPAQAGLAHGLLERSGEQAEGQLQHTLSWSLATLSARLRLRLALSARADAMDARSEVAGGLWWRPDRRWALNVGFGNRRHADGGADQRLSVTGVWRPTGAHLVFSRWHAVEDESSHELGLRWWLRPQRVSFDLVWPTRAIEAPVGASLRLRWLGFDL